jgi:DNA-binding GntR family transcriptional regulator
MQVPSRARPAATLQAPETEPAPAPSHARLPEARGRPPTLHDDVLGRLRGLIIEGELSPGDRVNERIVCGQLGISRTPLREALKVLASEGLVQLLPNRGARVTHLTEPDLRAMFEVLACLEALAGELACARMSEAEIAEIQALHYQMEAHYHRRQPPAYFTLNQTIHRRLVEGAGNPVLLAHHTQLNARVQRARFLANRFSDARWQQAMAEHGELLDALRRRDGPRLGGLLAHHLRNKCDAICEQLAPRAATLAG